MFISLALIFGIIIFLFNGLPKLMTPSVLERIKQDGELVVYTRNSPSTYYEGPDAPAGLEYDMAKMFADELGVKLTMVIPETLGDILEGVKDGRAHFAAAGLTVTEERKKQFRFGPAYQEVTEQLVYHADKPKPKNLSALGNGSLEVVAGSSHEERLKYLKNVIEDLSWRSVTDLETEDLMQLVAEEIIDYTIADSNEIALNKPFYLKLRVAFDISEPQPLAWMFPKSNDDSLYKEAIKFFDKIKENGELTRMIERAYGHVDNLNYVGTVVFRRQIAQRLPAFESMFRKYARKFDLDWRMLVAIGYQESLLIPDAKSPTGVRGLMMLTRKTAKAMGINNRLDPESSIKGGAKYFDITRKLIPEEVDEPDRTWFALAAYNVGFYHLQDARMITEKRGLDPNKWLDVKTSLPLLAQRKWYKDTKYGYARGWEPVRYVENIRSYYDILRRDDEAADPDLPEPDIFSILPNVP
ncbi:MAG: membrane-bound lytic murein transglycosylase MltF [Gammaproteobacteria bacterium]